MPLSWGGAEAGGGDTGSAHSWGLTSGHPPHPTPTPVWEVRKFPGISHPKATTLGVASWGVQPNGLSALMRYPHSGHMRCHPMGPEGPAGGGHQAPVGHETGALLGRPGAETTWGPPASTSFLGTQPRGQGPVRG